MDIAIHGVGVVGAFGAGTTALLSALRGGPVQPTFVEVPAQGHVFRIPVFRADTQRLESYVAKRSLRRLDHFSRMAALGAFLALEDAGSPITAPRKVGVVISSSYGAAQSTFAFLDSMRDGRGTCASPTSFSNSVHNAAAANVAILTKAHGPSVTLSQFEMSGPCGLLTACHLLEEKRADFILFGAVDEFCSVLGYSWLRLFPFGDLHEMKPLEFHAQTALTGEGSAFFLLSRTEDAHRPYAHIKAVEMGRIRIGQPELSPAAFLILGADGHKRCSRFYPDCIPPGSQVVAYAPLYGSFPTATAMDLAIAALSLKHDRIFPGPVREGEIGKWRVITSETPINNAPVFCLKTDSNGNYGLITLEGALPMKGPSTIIPWGVQ